MLKVVVETDVELYDKLMMYEFSSKNRITIGLFSTKS